MALNSEYLKIYEGLILKKLSDGKYEFTPHDNEDAEYFKYRLSQEFGKLLQRQGRLNSEYRAHRPDSHIINRQIETSNNESQDILKKLKAIKLWADKNNVKLPIFESGKVLESIIKGFERRVKVRVDEILSNYEKRFSELEGRNTENVKHSPQISKNAKKIEGKGIKKDFNLAIWALADDMRSRKEKGEFDTYRQAYLYAERHYTARGKPVTVKQLESNFYKAKSSGYV